MNLQMVKHSVSKVAGLSTITTALILLSLPAIAGIGDAMHRKGSKPQQTSQTAPTVPTAPSMEAPVTSPTGSPAVVPTTTPAIPTRTPATAPASQATAGTIVEVATASGSFKTLVEAVKAADLATTLSGQGPYTVFAPTDAAFAALPKGTVETLLKPENKDKLRKILSYHVVSGAVESTDLQSGAVKTVEGSPVRVQVTKDEVMVNDAKVTNPDIKASNGVIHVIDKVILPPDM